LQAVPWQAAFGGHREKSVPKNRFGTRPQKKGVWIPSYDEYHAPSFLPDVLMITRIKKKF
jgi:hypothetical protein